MRDVIVPEADCTVAAARDLQGAGGVFVGLPRVLAAVEFNRELAAGTGEIDDIRSDRMLPPKAVLARKLAQSQLHRLLGFRRSPPQLPGNPRPPFQHQAMLPSAPYLPLCPCGAERAGGEAGIAERRPLPRPNPCPYMVVEMRYY